MSKYGVFPGPYFLAFRLNAVNLRIQSKYKEIRTRKNSVFGNFSRSVIKVLLIQKSVFERLMYVRKINIA